MELDAAAGIGGHRRAEVAPAAGPLRHLDGHVLAGVVGQRLVQLQPDHRDVAGHPIELDDGAVAERRTLLGVGGAAHHPDEQLQRRARGVVELVVPVLAQMAAQRRVERLVHAVVMALRDTVFAVIAAQLSQECHRLLGALVDELTEQPRQGLAEHLELCAQIGRKQVTHRHVDGEPLGVELADQVLGPEAWVDRVAQHPQPVAVVESHAA